MAKINKSSDIEIEEIEQKFTNSMRIAWEIFNEYAFRKIEPYSYSPLRCSKNNYINKALFETWSINFSVLQDRKGEIEKLKERKKVLIENFSNLLNGKEKDSKFIKAINSDSQDIKYRFEAIENLIRKVLND